MVTDSSPTIVQRLLTFTTADRVSLRGCWFESANGTTQPATAVVIAGGAGIRAKSYRHLARYLAARGAAVLTFDYRGIGASRNGDLGELAAGMDDWAALDFGAALAEARATYPGLRLTAAAHSVGTLYVGAAPDAARLQRLVFLGPHTGYWRDYGSRWRWVMFLTWHCFMPIVTKVFGYFPGRALHLGEDLPAQVAFDWAGRRQPEIVSTLEDERRFGPSLARYGDIHADVLVLSITDDAFAPPKAALRLLSNYPNLNVTHESIAPAILGRRRLGHFGFLRQSAGEFFWRRAADWLLKDDASRPPSAMPVTSADIA